MTVTEIRALIERLEDETFVRVSFDENPSRYYPQTITDAAAAALRQLLDAAANHEIALAEAAAKARAEAFERCAKYADTAFLVPPDGG